MGRRIRERFEFWLEIDKDEQFELADVITDLKKQRKFAQTVRDGIMLVVSLRAGEVDVLLDLFPWIEDRLSRRAGQPPRLPSGMLRLPDPADDELVMDEREFRGPRQIATPPLPAPDYDEDDMDLLSVTKAVGQGNSGANFMNSIGKLG